jgi:ribosomal protein L3 glutamine methyltransferase
MQSKTTTLREIIQQSVEKFNQANLHFGHGTDNAYDEAVNIALRALNLAFDSAPSILKRQLTKEECLKIEKLINERIKKRIPAAYLLKEAWFAGLQFYVDERVMIPRSSMAELIEQKFHPWIDENQVHNILDLGTGSGCIAITCAIALPKTQVDAIDISANALKVAKINVQKHHLEKRVHLLHGDLFAPIGKQKYDIIVSNPPYVSSEEIRTLPKEYSHEPKLAFYGGKNKGLDLVIKIIQKAKNHLTKNGILVVEVGNNCETLQEKLPQIPFIWPDFEHGEGGIFILSADLI